MAGVLEDLFNVRTNGNGFVTSEWDHILLRRDLARLVEEGRVKEIPGPFGPSSLGDVSEQEWFQDSETGEIYRYKGPWERGGPHFDRISD